MNNIHMAFSRASCGHTYQQFLSADTSSDSCFHRRSVEPPVQTMNNVSLVVATTQGVLGVVKYNLRKSVERKIFNTICSFCIGRW